jgi:hypothetical protein
MDTKLKIVLVIFILVLIAYGIYFVIRDYNKQKSNMSNEKHFIEKYEDYDIRKQILNELDTYSINNKTKTEIYDKLVADIDNLKNMSKDRLDDHIRDVVNAKKKVEKKAPEEVQPKPAKETFKDAMEESDDEPENEPKAPQAAKEPFVEDDKIESMLDKTMSDLKQIKSMVSDMGKRCKASPSHNIIDSPGLKLDMPGNDSFMKKDKKEKAVTETYKANKKDKKESPLEKPPVKRLGRDDDEDEDDDKDEVIEGFENFSAKRFAFI